MQHDSFNQFTGSNLINTINPVDSWYKWNTDGLNFFYANVNRLISDKRRESFLVYLCKFKINFDIIILVETFYENQINILNITGYNSYHTIRNTNGGGVSIYVNNCHSSQKIDSYIVNGNEFLLIKLDSLRLNVGGIYRPPDTSLSNFLIDFQSFVNKSDRAKLLIFGDINLNLLTDSSINVAYKNLFTLNGMVLLNLINEENATRMSNTLPSIIDHVASNCLSNKHKLILLDNSFSDHRHVILNVSMKNESDQMSSLLRVKKFTNYKAVHDETLKTLNESLTIADFQHEISRITNNNTSVNKVKVKKIKLKNPWFSNEALKLQKLKDFYYKKKKKYPCNPTWQSYFDDFNRKYYEAIVRDKKSYCEVKLHENIDNPRNLWRFFGELMHGKKEVNSQIIKVKKDNNLLSDPKAVANEFNEFFTTIGSKLNSTLPNITRHSNKYVIRNPLSDFEQTSPGEIQEIVESLKPNAATGHDNISLQFLKTLDTPVYKYLSKEINRCLSEGIFPETLKIAKVVPLHKDGDKQDCNNYRPISVLSVISKIFEKVIKSRLENHLEANHLIHENQFGFTRLSNTTAATMNLLNQIYTKSNKKKALQPRLGAIFIDLKKAFDTVSHGILLEKLNEMGVQGIFLRILKSFLSNRKQFVQINNEKSDEKEIPFGIGQGTILGPLLFTVFINDLLSLRLNSYPQLFADDGVMLFEASTNSELETKMISDMNILYEWLVQNKLSLNVGKTKFLIWHKFDNPLDPTFDNLQFSAGVLERVETYEYLGLVLDSELSFKKHVEKVISKINPYVGILGRLKYYLPVRHLKLIYYAYIHSSIHYVLPAYGSCLKTHTNELNMIHKRALKNVFKLPFDHPTTKVYEKGIPKLEIMIAQEMVLLQFRMRNNLIKTNFSATYRQDVSGRQTRQSDDLDIAFTQHNFIKDTFFFKGVSLFNSLPSHIKVLSNIDEFKRESLRFLENDLMP